VAVSKLMPVETLMLAYNENQRHFGENYVQEICDKAPQMPDDIRWHFIGGLQSNKAKMLVQALFLILQKFSCAIMFFLIDHGHSSSGEWREGSLHGGERRQPEACHTARQGMRGRQARRAASHGAS